MIGISGMGWKKIDYTDKESVILHLERVSMIAKCIEIPFVLPTWVPEIKDRVQQDKINIDSIHLPKQFVYEDERIQNKIAIATRFIVSQLGIKKVIVHPFDYIAGKKDITKVLKSIQLINTDAMFEITSKEFVEQMNLYSVGKLTGLAIDISHYMRIMNGNLSKLCDLKASHIHLRGYVREKRYARINESKDSVRMFLNTLAQCNFVGNIILEYPYSSYEDAEDDVDEIKRLLGEINGLLF